MKQVRRYTNHLNEFYPSDGLSGEVVFDNVNNSIIPLIELGKLLHVGSEITCGYGEYKSEYFAQT